MTPDQARHVRSIAALMRKHAEYIVRAAKALETNDIKPFPVQVVINKLIEMKYTATYIVNAADDMLPHMPKDGGDQLELPDLLFCSELGYHEPLPYWKNPEIDDPEWISQGWCARTYEGNIFFRHNEENAVREWLTSCGYRDQGDHHHYRRGGETSEPSKSVCVRF